MMKALFLPLRLACLLVCLPLIGGCIFGEPEKRGSVEDELEVETDLALRMLDGADVAGAVPTLARLADNAGRVDEIGLRIQTLLLTARTLDGEATLWPPDKAAGLRQAAVRHADLALREAGDWHRFEPESEEAALLTHDARILRARLSPESSGETEALLEAAIAGALSRDDAQRLTAWRLALCGAQLTGGRLEEARRTLVDARASFAKAAKAARKNDPATGALRLALAEAEGDVALHGGQTKEAAEFYNNALDMARALRRRDEIRRLLLRLSTAAERSGDTERSAWYKRRAEGVARTPPARRMEADDAPDVPPGASP